MIKQIKGGLLMSNVYQPDDVV